mgnify:CR=1 FL=1
MIRTICALAICLATSGCRDTPAVVPVSGRVLYNGEPLQFGTVMFQPAVGQAAVGEIQPDGSFTLSTYEPGDGAVPGAHKVCVRCYEGQRPGAGLKQTGGEVTLGALLIPRKYTRFGTSGLAVDIVDGDNPPLDFDLTGPQR